MRNTMLLLGLMGLVGCSTEAIGDGATTESDLAESYWVPDTNMFTIQVKGSGEVPAGSGCAAGDRTYTVTLDTKKIRVSECLGATLRTQGRELPTTDEQWDAIIAAARGVKRSEKTTCDAWKSAYVSMNTFASSDLTPWAISDRFACEGSTSPTTTYATGIESVLALLDPIAESTPREPKTIYYGEQEMPERLWTDASDSLTLWVVGSGETPEGSSCVEGALSYSLDVKRQMASISTCAANEKSGDRLRPKTRSFALSAAEITQLSQSARATSVTPFASCVPDGTVMRAMVTDMDAAETEDRYITFLAKENACVMGVDRGPYVDFTAFRAAFERVIAAHPAP